MQRIEIGYSELFHVTNFSAEKEVSFILVSGLHSFPDQKLVVLADVQLNVTPTTAKPGKVASSSINFSGPKIFHFLTQCQKNYSDVTSSSERVFGALL